MRRSLLFALYIVCSAALLVSCGGASGNPDNSDAEPPPAAGGGGGAAPPAPVVQRQGQFAYPQRLQVDKPAPVQFSLYAEGADAPLTASGALKAERPVAIPSQPGLAAFVRVELDHSGAELVAGDAADGTDEVQPLYETSNVWRWHIVVREKQEVMLRPQIHIEYRDSAGTTTMTKDIAWGETYTINKVDDAGSLGAVGGWFGDNLVGLLGIVIGIPGTISTVRSLARGSREQLGLG